MTRRIAALLGVIRQYEGQPCTACDGNGGSTQSETDGTTLRQTWRPCTSCGGKGVR
ncbi:hypothetical protein QZH56_37035 (plasmid) [Streptomyces olivoreticuli]|uniref:hypothetical protein n=1 Tax=Streptomyces olivoreticuli TaxID=68246 RepID=UPI002659EF13|nr:hypothetical protein [Streptomyces olivoreticuli]WKK27858.1 hypothetical protein QZH56_37035 [Streptomyces olivoreticuli]